MNKNSQSNTTSFQSRVLVSGTAALASSSESATAPLLVSDIGLSFWGGIDPVTSQIVDAQHPLHGQYVQDTILCIPTGRGSCTASQVLLQLILNHKSPRAIVLRQNDPLLAVGALIAQHVLNDDESLQIPAIVMIGTDAYDQLLSLSSSSSERRLEGQLDMTNAQLLVSGSFDSNDVTPQSEQQHHSNHSTIETTSIDIPWTLYEQERWNQAKSAAERLALQVMFHYARIAMMEETTSSTTSQTPSYVSVSRAHIVRLIELSCFVLSSRQRRILTLYSSLATTGRLYLHWIGQSCLGPTIRANRWNSANTHDVELGFHRSTSVATTRSPLELCSQCQCLG